jgi:inosine-uridine nucleoside N-ribohydrolase
MKLWFDTDPGVDDALAMALIASRPEFEWIGVSTVFGNASVAKTTRNALNLLARLGRAEVPVHAGAAAPLVGSARFAAEVHGGDGLGGIADSLRTSSHDAAALSAAEAIVRASREHADLQLAAVGPLTNIALALRLDPGLAERVAGLTVMGGAFGQQGQSGNVTPAAEANIHNDARAAAEVFAAPWSQLRIVGLDATHCVRLKPAQVAALREGGSLAQWLHRLVEPYMQFYGEYYGEPMLVAHDAIALLPLLMPESFHWRRGVVRVVEGGLAHGQTLQDWQRLGDADWQAMPAHEVALSAEPESISSLCLRAWLHA